jgi:hypothetical protein
MTDSENTTFEAQYRADLERAGLDPVDAAELAAKTARMRAAAVQAATMKNSLVKGGMHEGRAKAMAAAHTLFSSPLGEKIPAATKRVDGFQSMSDIIRPSTAPKSDDDMQVPASPLVPSRPKAKVTPLPAPAPAPARPRRAAKAPPAAQEAPPGVELPTQAEKPAVAPKAVKRTSKRIDPITADIIPMTPVFDYRNGELPERVRDLIEAHLAIEAQDAKSSGSLGFMTRSLAIATLPHRKTTDFRFVRRNGDFTLTMMTAHPQGLPYGTLPRLLLTWVCTEVAQKRERVLSLGNNLASYLGELGLHNTGGKRGDITRLKHAMTTLFSSVISCHYEGKDSFALQNVLLADKVDWWTPQNPEEAGQWQSSVMLSEPFFKECIEHVLPFDMRAVRGLRQSPLALDIYIWLTYRMSYLSKRTTIPWIALAGQFGSGYATSEQGLRDFKRAFLRELKHVLVIYPQAKVADGLHGLVMYPSPPHVAYKSTPIQKGLGF